MNIGIGFNWLGLNDGLLMGSKMSTQMAVSEGVW